jgi:L-iditol 2-dehydrogenase
MRALVKASRGPGYLSLHADWPEPKAEPGWVVADVTACGICGTDLHIQHDQHKYWPPVVLGHEYTGRISAIGNGVAGWRPGDRIVCEQHSLACGRCDACRRGAIHLCAAKRSPGWGIDGAFADKVALPATLLHRVPDSVPDEAAVLTEPLAIALTGVDRSHARAGETALVIGPGTVGLLTALILRASGLRVLLAGRASSAARLELAASLGIETASDDEAADRVAGFSPRGGADVVFEASGSEGGVGLAVASARTLGRVVCLGLSGRPQIAFPADEAMRRALEFRFCMSSEYSTWDRALALLASGAFDPRPLVTGYPLEAWEQAFQDLAERRVVKAALMPALR